MEDAAKKHRESSLAEQESRARKIDFKTLSASFAALVKGATLIDPVD